MDRTKTFVKAIKRIGLLSGAGLIAISASAFPGTAGSAAAPAANQQVAEGRQQQQNSPPQWQQQRPDKSHQGGQGQSRQQWSQHNGQGQPRQQWTQQNGKSQGQQQWTQQNGKSQGQQQWGQQNGQTHSQQQWSQQNGQPRYQGGNGQGQQQWSQQGGQQHWQQNSQGHRYNWASYTPGHRPAQWDQYHRNFDPRAYETARYAERRYHWAPYRQPYGWYYRQFGDGCFPAKGGPDPAAFQGFGGCVDHHDRSIKGIITGRPCLDNGQGGVFCVQLYFFSRKDQADRHKTGGADIDLIKTFFESYGNVEPA